MAVDEDVQFSRRTVANGNAVTMTVRGEGSRGIAGREETLEASSLGTRFRNILPVRGVRAATGGSSAAAVAAATGGAGMAEHGIGPTSTRIPPKNSIPTKKSYHRCHWQPPLVMAMVLSGVVAAFGLLVLVDLSPGNSRKVELPAPAPSGMPWKVAHSRSFVVDYLRKDPYNETEDRKVAYSIFMPVFNEACGKTTDNDYMPNLTAQFSNLQFFGDKSAGVFDKLHFESCSKNTDDYNANHFPLLIFEPAVGTSRFMYNQLARQLSANGAHVVTIDHPYDAPIVEFVGLDPIHNSGAVTLNAFEVNKPVNDTEVKTAIDTRIADVNTVIRELEKNETLPRLFPEFTFAGGNTKISTRRLFMLGHGLGGSVATSMGFGDKRVELTINLSGSTPLITVPALAYTIFFGRGDYRSEDDAAWQETKKYIVGPQVEWTYNKADQFDFSDLSLVSYLVDPEKKAKGLGTPYEDIDPNDPTATFRALSCFLEGYLRDTVMSAWLVNPRLPGESRYAIQECLGRFGNAIKPHVWAGGQSTQNN